jgi:hypothetical protein
LCRRDHLIEPVGAGAAAEFDFDFLDLFEVKAREYRDDDPVFTRRTEARLQRRQ